MNYRCFLDWLASMPCVLVTTVLPGLSFPVSVLAYGIIFQSLSAWHHHLATRPTECYIFTLLSLSHRCSLCTSSGFLLIVQSIFYTFTSVQHSKYRELLKITSELKSLRPQNNLERAEHYVWTLRYVSHKSWIIHSCLTAPHTSIMVWEESMPYFHLCNSGHIT